jgi:hypothetical protein
LIGSAIETPQSVFWRPPHGKPLPSREGQCILSNFYRTFTLQTVLFLFGINALVPARGIPASWTSMKFAPGVAAFEINFM